MSGLKPDMMLGHEYSPAHRSGDQLGATASPEGHYARRVQHPGQISDTDDAAFVTVRSQKDRIHRFAGLGVGMAGVCAEHILSHPCIVLRRQCQVHTTATWYHTTPFTLLPVIFNIQRNQMIHHKTLTTLWKGIGSTMTVKALAVASEAALSEFTPLPKEANRHSSVKKLLEHIILKGLSIIIVTPFYASSLVETVQSEIASERPGVFDCLREGANRLLGWSTSQTTRLLPVWRLVVPGVLYGLSHYIITSLAQYNVLVASRAEMQESKEHLGESAERSLFETRYAELIATFTGNLLADMMLYPLETVLHRLCLQGTRTIIDNTDTGVGVMPIITRYEGMYDCFCSILREEGLLGFYKGFGALVLQYSLHVAVLQLTKFVFERLSHQNLPAAATRASHSVPGDRARLLQGRIPGSGPPPPSVLQGGDASPQYYPQQGYSPYYQQAAPMQPYASPGGHIPPYASPSTGRQSRSEFTAL